MTCTTDLKWNSLDKGYEWYQVTVPYPGPIMASDVHKYFITYFLSKWTGDANFPLFSGFTLRKSIYEVFSLVASPSEPGIKKHLHALIKLSLPPERSWTYWTQFDPIDIYSATTSWPSWFDRVIEWEPSRLTEISVMNYPSNPFLCAREKQALNQAENSHKYKKELTGLG